MTCSEDGHFKCFNFEGDCYVNIDINSFGEYLWELPFDWLAVKEKEITAILKIVEEAENTKMDPATQTKHESVYYYEVYLRRHFEEVRAEAAKKPSYRQEERDMRIERLINLHNTRSQKIRELADDGRNCLTKKSTCLNPSSCKMVTIQGSSPIYTVCQSSVHGSARSSTTLIRQWGRSGTTSPIWL